LDDIAKLKDFGAAPRRVAGSMAMSVVLPNFNHAERLPLGDRFVSPEAIIGADGIHRWRRSLRAMRAGTGRIVCRAG
jgi:hypothetical protein